MGVPRVTPVLRGPAARRAVRDTRSEKQVEALGDRIMATLGFTVIRFSQPRHTMQTPGIPDRLYVHATRKLLVWWEAKAATGRQSEAQRGFQDLMYAVGVEYVCGTDDALVGWLKDRGLIR